MAKPRTLYDKIWEDHLVDEQPDGTCLIYIDRHLVHEMAVDIDETGARRHLSHLYRPPSRARGDEPAGLRGLAPLRPQGSRTGKDALRRRSQRADHRPQSAQPGSGKRGRLRSVVGTLWSTTQSVFSGA